MIMAGTLSVTPVSLYVRLSIHTYVTPNDDLSLSLIFFIRMNLSHMFITIKSSLRSIMVHISSCLQELWYFVYENSLFEIMLAL